MSVALPFHGMPAAVDAANVLLAQGDTVNRQTCALVLGDAGFCVKHTADGLKAWQEVATWPPNIVVLDLVLPGLDGLELCRRLRREARTTTSLIVGVSKSTGVADHLAAVRCGFDLLLNQPCDPRMLLGEIMHARIRAAGARRRSELALARASAARSDAVDALERSRQIRDRNGQRLTRQQAFARIRSTYFELPGLTLTAEQGARLWELDLELCTAVLDELLRRKFLVRVENQYTRAFVNTSFLPRDSASMAQAYKPDP
jgi:DNA-binding response OmpR family regulator